VPGPEGWCLPSGTRAASRADTASNRVSASQPRQRRSSCGPARGQAQRRRHLLCAAPPQQLPAAGAHHATGQAAIGLHRPAAAVGTGHRCLRLTLAPSMFADASRCRGVAAPEPGLQGRHQRCRVAISAVPDRPLAARPPQRARAATRSRRSRIPGPRSRSPGSSRRGCGRPATSRRGPPARC
jgi:hypothetical protein